MDYDNRYNGFLFATADTATLAGPFTGESDDELRIVCQLSEPGGVHPLTVRAKRKDGKGYKVRPVARGHIRRSNRADDDGPIAHGSLANGTKRVPIVIWHKRLADGRTCYQVKPDKFAQQATTEVPPL